VWKFQVIWSYFCEFWLFRFWIITQKLAKFQKKGFKWYTVSGKLPRYLLTYHMLRSEHFYAINPKLDHRKKHIIIKLIPTIYIKLLAGLRIWNVLVSKEVPDMNVLTWKYLKVLQDPFLFLIPIMFWLIERIFKYN